MEELEQHTQDESPENQPAEPESSATAEAAEEAGEPEVSLHEEALSDAATEPAVSVDELLQSQPVEAEPAEAAPQEDTQLKAVLEAIIYVAEEPLTLAQIAASLHEPPERIAGLLAQLTAEFEAAGHGICVREIAGGYKMATKPEHHEAVRNFVKSLKPPLKLSLPALETLSVIAYKQPVTGPEIMEIRGVQGGGVLKTLLDRKLIAAAGRKNVIGKPILYKTTKEFLIQFGLKDLAELPSLKEFEEIRRMAFADEPQPEVAPPQEPEPEIPAEPPEGPETEPDVVPPVDPEPEAVPPVDPQQDAGTPHEPAAGPAASEEA